MTRTFVIGDIHGDLSALERLLQRLPPLSAEDTVVFLGDYIDHGPDSLGVIQRVQGISREIPAKVVPLRGNHEDMWIDCFTAPSENAGFLIVRGNGCAATYRSFTSQPPLEKDEWLGPGELERLIDLSSWMPKEIIDWMASLPLWYEDEHAIYVHAGLEGEGREWKHPKDCLPKPLLWMREPDFYTGYQGKRLVFGHTAVRELPTEHLGWISGFLDDPWDVWIRGDLIGVDTGCGKGGYLSAIELPSLEIYESR